MEETRKPYIEKVRLHIDSKFVELDFRNHRLAEWCHVSRSKFEKDFKRTFGVTANQYIKQKKMEKARELLQKNIHYTQFDIMENIGWNYTDRSYRQAYKKLVNDSQNKASSCCVPLQDDYDFIAFIEGKHIFDDILLRFVLYLQLGKPKKKSINSAEIVVDIQDTLIQFTPFGFDDKLYLTLYFDIDNDLVRTTGMTTRMDDKENCYIPNTLQPYFSLLNNIYHGTVGQLNFDIRKTVRNWHQFVEGGMASTGSFLDWTNTKPFKNCRVEVDTNSEFSIATSHLIEELKKNFKSDIKNTLAQEFNLNLDALLQYIDYIKNENYAEIERLVSIEWLRIGAEPLKLKAVDLILKVTEYPALQDVDVENYEFEFPKELLKNVTSKIVANKFGILLVAFRKSINLHSDSDKYNPSLVLEDLLRTVQLT